MRTVDKTLDKWSQKELDYIFKNYKGISYKDMLEKVTKKYHKHHNFSQIKGVYAKYNLTNEVDVKFKPGNIPFTKGKKIEEYMSKKGIENSSKTRFKKGNIPPNVKKIGSKRYTEDGVMVKVSNNKWEYEHRIKWIKKYGQIPDGYQLFHIDLNNWNNKLNNLCLITQAERLYLNRSGEMIKGNKEINETLINIARVQCKVNALTRKERSK